MPNYGKTVPRSFLNEKGEPVAIKVQLGPHSVGITIQTPRSFTNAIVSPTEAKQLLLALMEVFEE